MLNETNEVTIHEKTKDVRKIKYNLDNAERISGTAIFTWSVKEERLEISDFFSR